VTARKDGIYLKQNQKIMTPQEKANELISLHSLTIISEVGNKLTMHEVKQLAKQAALLSVDEMLEFTKITEKSTLTICTPDDCFCEETTYYNDYLIEVKSEIEAL
jgi:hypothetical protein